MNKKNDSYNYQFQVEAFDELTNCYKREALYEKIKEAVDENKDFILLKIDIDDFADFNNRFGHITKHMAKSIIKISEIINIYF